MKPEYMKDPVERNAIETVLQGIAARSEPDRQKWVTMIATTAISVLHGTYGKEYTAGYLQGAVQSLLDPNQAAPIEVMEVPGRKQ